MHVHGVRVVWTLLVVLIYLPLSVFMCPWANLRCLLPNKVVNYGLGGHYEPHYDFARVRVRHRLVYRARASSSAKRSTV